jgi:hypothetical protein
MKSFVRFCLCAVLSLTWLGTSSNVARAQQNVFVSIQVNPAVSAQTTPSLVLPVASDEQAAVPTLQSSVLEGATAGVQHGKTTVELRTGIIKKLKHGKTEEAVWAASLDTYDGERAISFPMIHFSRQALLYGQVGYGSSGLIFVTAKTIVYRTDKGKVELSCARSASALKQEGGRSGDTFSLDDERGERFRFGIAKFDSPFMVFFQAAVANFQGAYTQAEQLAAAGPSPVAEPMPQISRQVQIAQQQAAAEPEAIQTAQQQAFQQADLDESNRKLRMEQLKADIEIQQNSAANWDKSVQDMAQSNNNNCTMSGLTGLFCHGIGAAGIAKAKKEAAKAKNQMASDQEELERLQGLEVQNRPRQDASFGGNFQQAAAIVSGTSPSQVLPPPDTIENAAMQQQANLQALAAASQQRQQAQAQHQPVSSTSAPAARSSSVTTATTVGTTNATPGPAPSSNGNNPYSSAPAQGSYNPYTGTGSESVQGSCTDMTGSVQGTVKVGSDGWVSGYLTNNSNQTLYVSYTFKQNGVPSTAMANAGGTTIQGGQTVGGEGQGLYSTGADKNPPEIYWYAVLKSEHDQYGCVHKW